jgi:hypothetical protein
MVLGNQKGKETPQFVLILIEGPYLKKKKSSSMFQVFSFIS